jgi:aspartyl-tRNA(Asn)/glutamyl-tRNA(Gln) amidotransferase subunit C
MTLDRKDVARIANLARLDITEEDAVFFEEKLNGTLGWIDQLQAVNTDGVEPLASVVDMVSVLRKDIVTDGHKPQDILKNAPESVEGFFVVPKVVE